jgi:hypothetical protein
VNHIAPGRASTDPSCPSHEIDCHLTAVQGEFEQQRVTQIRQRLREMAGCLSSYPQTVLLGVTNGGLDPPQPTRRSRPRPDADRRTGSTPLEWIRRNTGALGGRRHPTPRSRYG